MVGDFRKEQRFNEYVDMRGFLFWQTGLAYGFLPDSFSIPQYHGGYSFGERIVLFLTVGPIVLAESSIIGIYQDFIILFIVQIIWFAIRKEHIWWDK